MWDHVGPIRSDATLGEPLLQTWPPQPAREEQPSLPGIPAPAPSPQIEIRYILDTRMSELILLRLDQLEARTLEGRWRRFCAWIRRLVRS